MLMANNRVKTGTVYYVFPFMQSGPGSNSFWILQLWNPTKRKYHVLQLHYVNQAISNIVCLLFSAGQVTSFCCWKQPVVAAENDNTVAT